MNREIDAYQSYFTCIFDDSDLANRLARAATLQQHIERDFCRQMTHVSSHFELVFPHLDLPVPAYVEKNFFSIFLLSILDTLGIHSERLHAYGLITHAIRGVVTATDNISDNETKGAVQLHMGQARVAPNTMLVVLQDGIIHQMLIGLTEDSLRRRHAWHALMEAVFAILHEESGEEGVVESALPPNVLLETIHGFRGGKLFQLAFVVPEALEDHLATPFVQVKEGVYAFGLAIQILDDLADLAEDLDSGNHNFLHSWIVHKQADGAFTSDALQSMSAEALSFPEHRFPHSTRDVVLFAASMAQKGFTFLRESGYPLSRRSGDVFLHMLFHSRGVQRLWAMYEGFSVV